MRGTAYGVFKTALFFSKVVAIEKRDTDLGTFPR